MILPVLSRPLEHHCASGTYELHEFCMYTIIFKPLMIIYPEHMHHRPVSYHVVVALVDLWKIAYLV